MTIDKKVIDSLTEDKAKQDASYGYRSDSIEPIAEGAFKGALASGVASRLVRDDERLLRLMPKRREAVLIGAGTALGALGGKLYNDRMTNRANAARKWLSDKRKSSDYIKNTRNIYKQSSDNNISPDLRLSIGDAKEMAYDNGKKIEDSKSKKMSAWDIAKDTAKWGIGSAVVGGLAGRYRGAIRGLLSKMKFTKPHTAEELDKIRRSRNFRGLVGATKWGSLGAGGTIVPDMVSNGMNTAENNVDNGKSEHGALKSALNGAAVFGAGGAVEPIIHRTIGKHVVGRYDKYGDLKKEYENKIKPKKAISRSGLFSKAREFVPFLSGKNYEAENIIHGLNSYRNKTPALKGVSKPMLKSFTRNAIGGAALMYGLHKLTDHLSNNRDVEKTASMNGDDLISAEDAEAQKIINNPRINSIAKKIGLAALAFGIGRKLTGTNVGGMRAAELTALYSVPKMAYEEYERSRADDFLKKSRGEKLSVIREKEDDKRFGSSDLLKAYVGSKVIDEYTIPSIIRTESVDSQKKAKKKFNIKDNL